ncbi:putative nuclease of putative toxin-antitoxin system [Desulfomicrobium macestii]|uniref:Nuclease of putative toxin-antitoxin system n=1 Tax=Desulfomicrobium macestii TaxID=90731 RepID=A0ABR9H7S5_9BACT|nr:DNA-binding protein [Desulfomicrobium macestii]MBE1426747.1 putative nuclease of putative toxin-antitoxin system [Desulfomicrobium macestii]
MAQSKILVDTNIYLRFAQSIHPLLFRPFCPDEFTLYITHCFQREYDRQPRLREKFCWVNEDMYSENRSQRINISSSQQNEAALAIGYISDYSLAQSLGVQDVDIDILAHALALDVPVVTDDRDMTLLANVFSIEVWNSLQLMKAMLDCNHVSQKDIDALVNYMEYMEDLPWRRYVQDYARMFPQSKFNTRGAASDLES